MNTVHIYVPHFVISNISDKDIIISNNHIIINYIILFTVNNALKTLQCLMLIHDLQQWF